MAVLAGEPQPIAVGVPACGSVACRQHRGFAARRSPAVRARLMAGHPRICQAHASRPAHPRRRARSSGPRRWAVCATAGGTVLVRSAARRFHVSRSGIQDANALLCNAFDPVVVVFILDPILPNNLGSIKLNYVNFSGMCTSCDPLHRSKSVACGYRKTESLWCFVKNGPNLLLKGSICCASAKDVNFRRH